MRKKVRFVEITSDADLREKEPEATAVVRRHFPGPPRVKLYRTADGRVGIQMQLALAVGERKQLEEAYRAVMRLLGENRGRPVGARTVQTKLRLPEPMYRAIKRAACASNATMSSVVADLARKELI